MHGAGELGTSLLKLAELRIMLLVVVEVVGDDGWDLGCFILVHVNVLGKASNVFHELCIAFWWFGEKLERRCWFDAGASADFRVRGVIVLKWSLSPDRRVGVLVKFISYQAFQTVQPLPEEEDFCILGVEGGVKWRRGRGCGGR